MSGPRQLQKGSECYVVGVFIKMFYFSDRSLLFHRNVRLVVS